MASRSTTKVQYACGCPRSRCFNPGITLCRSGIWTSRITSIDFDPDLPSQETVGACLLELTHGILLDDTCVLNSAGMIFRLQQFLKKKKKQAAPSYWRRRHFCCRLERRRQHWRYARECKLWRELQVETLVVAGAKSILGTASTLWSRKVWISYNHTFSCFRAVRYLGFADSLFKFCVNAIAFQISTGSGTSIVGSSCSGRATSI